MKRRSFFGICLGATGCAVMEPKSAIASSCPESADAHEFEVRKAKDGWRWRLWSRNKTDIIAESGEAYVNKVNCENGIALVKRSWNTEVKILDT